MTPRPLSSFLTRLIWLCMAPLLLLALWLAWESVQEHERQHLREGENLAKNYATAVDQFLNERLNALNLLAVSPLADDPRHWPALYAEAQGFRESFGTHVIFADTERRMRFITRSPFGAPLPQLPLSQGRSAAPLALATGKPQVGDIVFGPVSRQPLVAIAVPGLRDGRVTHLMLTTLETALLQQRLERVALPQGWSLALQDGTGADIARRSPPGFDAAREVDADHRFRIPLQHTPWTVLLEIPRASHYVWLYQSVFYLALLILLATALGWFGGKLASGRLARQVDGLSARDAPAAAPEIAEIAAARRQLDTAATELQASEAQFHAIFDSIQDAAVHADPERRIVLVNPAFTRLFGYSVEEVVGRSTEHLYADPGEYARLGQQRYHAMAGNDFTPSEMHYRRRDGSTFWAETTGGPVRAADGRLLGFLGIHRDITLRRQQEMERRIWAESFIHADFAVAISDARSNTFIAVNPAFARQRGYAPEALVGQSVMCVFPEDLHTSIRDRLAELATQAHGVIETEHQTIDGRRFPVLVDMTVIHDDEGRAVNRIAYALDLTQRKRAEAELAATQAAALQAREQARLAALNQMEDANAARREAEATSARLRDSEALLRSATDNAAVGLVMLDLNRRYTFVNPAYADILGLPYTAEELIGSGPAEALPEVYERQISPRLDRAFAGERVSYELTRPGHASGETAHYVVVYDPVQNDAGAVDGVIVTIFNITDIKRAEAALRESQERLQLLIDHAPAALAMFDRDMRYLAVSQRWRDDYFLSDREILGHSHYEIFPEIPDAWRAVHQRGMAGEIVMADEDRFERLDGSVQWLRWEVRPWHAHDGGIGGIVIFSEDITRLVAARHEILKLNAGLEHRVVERTAELSAANRELDAFAYAVSHDLRAPLRAMNGFAQALEDDYAGQLQGEAKAWLAQIGIASRRMGDLIDGILTLSRSTRGELRRDAVDLTALARRRLDELAAAEPGRAVMATVEEGLVARGDARMLEAALTNLLDNAWKYTGKVSAPAVRLYAEQREDKRWFCVADNGAGFDMAHATRLFQPFQRLHRQDEFPGIGIGLATVARIVHRHGGEIEARGAVGKGATFCFTLADACQENQA